MGRAPVGAEQTYLTQMAGDFENSGGDVRGLLEAIVLSPIFRTMLVDN
jgi:hypothetical protein